MGEGFLETDVDLLVSLVKEKGKITIESASKILKIPIKVIQKWVDFLIEEEILGVEYKFVTPYLFFNKDPENTSTVKQNHSGDYLEDKAAFFKKAESRGFPKNRTNSLWQKYLSSNLEEIKEHFNKKAEEKGLPSYKVNELWSKYYEYLKRVEK